MNGKLKVYAISKDGIKGYAVGYRILLHEGSGHATEVGVIWQIKRKTIYFRYNTQTPRRCYISDIKAFNKFKLGGHNKIVKMINITLCPMIYAAETTKSNDQLRNLTLEIAKEGMRRSFFTKPISQSKPIRIQLNTFATVAMYISLEDLE